MESDRKSISLLGPDNGFSDFFDVAADIETDDLDVYQSGGAMSEEVMG